MNSKILALFTLLTPCSVLSGEQTPTTPPNDSQIRDEEPVRVVPVDEIISVTATSNNFTFLQPSPVQRIDGSELVEFGSMNLRDILSELPSVVSDGSMASNASDDTGLNYVDLRHLGAKRTLILVNGKRQVAGSPDAMQLDLSTIAVALIDHIDVVTGGAAATYGADAISGVIDIHLKDSFQGQEIDLFGAGSLKGSFAGQSGGSYLYGSDFLGGRGNVNVYLAYEKTDRVMASDLEQFQQWGRAFNIDGQLGPQDAQLVWMPHMVNHFMSRTSVVNGQTFDEFGEAVGICQSEIQGIVKGYFPNGCNYAFYDEQYTTFIPDSQRTLVSTSINYDLTDDIQWAGEVKFSQSDNTQNNIANLFYTSSFSGVSDQPQAHEAMSLTRGGLYLAKLFDEFGEHYLTNDRQMFHVNSAISGTADFGYRFVDYELYLLYGENKSSQKTYNKAHLGYLSVAAQMALADEKRFNCERVVAQYEDDVPCIDYPFYGFDLADENVKSQLKGDLTDDKKIKLMAIGGDISTDTSGWLESDAGPIDIQLGFEWRKEQYDVAVENPILATEITEIVGKQNQNGQIITLESFVNLAAPLYVSDDGLQQLNMNTSLRLVDYSHIGQNFGWQLGFNYQASENWYWRATIEKSVRGPNLVEYFNQGIVSSVPLLNPCQDGKLYQNDDGVLDCAPSDGGILIAAANVDAEINGGGDTQEEDSRSKTFGVAWHHDNPDVLGISLDYFEYSINSAILDIDAERVFNNCFQFKELENNRYCSRIQMDNEFGMPKYIKAGFINAASMDLAGIDAVITHQSKAQAFGLSFEHSWRVNASYLLKLDQYEFLRDPDLVNYQRGEVGDPKWQISVNANFMYGAWTLDWNTQYTHRTSNIEITEGRETGLEAYPYYVGSIVTSDAIVGFSSDSGYQVNVGVRNLFNKVPPGYIDDFSYDLIGRRMFVQVNYGF